MRLGGWGRQGFGGGVKEVVGWRGLLRLKGLSSRRRLRLRMLMVLLPSSCLRRRCQRGQQSCLRCYCWPLPLACPLLEAALAHLARPLLAFAPGAHWVRSLASR